MDGGPARQLGSVHGLDGLLRMGDMVRLKRAAVLGLALTGVVGCQSMAPSSWVSRPPKRSDDPLLCTDAERKRPRDIYATTSEARTLGDRLPAIKLNR